MGKKPKLNLPTSYDVGYGKPPADTRFKPGRSGNPNGRPKGRKSKLLTPWWEERLKATILDEAYRRVKIRDNDKMVSIPMASAVVRAIALNAAKGNHRAAALFTQIVKVVEDENRAKHEEWMDTALNYKIEWEKEFQRLERMGQPLPVLYPNPSDIKLDAKRGTVIVDGPMTKEDEEAIERAKERLKECRKSIAAYWEDLSSETDPKIRKIIEREIAYEKKIETIITTHLPNWAK